MGRVDKLRRRCEGLLAPGEQILLEADARFYRIYLPYSGWGRAYLTAQRVAWLRRYFQPWIPDVVTLELSSMRHIRVWRQAPVVGLAALQIEASGKIHQFWLGKGLFLWHNASTTDEWLHAIERAEGPRPAPTVVKPLGSMYLGLILFLVMAMGPVWLILFFLLKLPLALLVVLGVFAVVGAVVGLLRLRFP